MNTEQIDAELWRLVEQATEPSQRATLMALYKINQSQSLMLKQLEAHDKTLNQHRALIDQGRGGWKALLGIGVMLWGLAVTAGAYYVNKIDSLRDDVAMLKATQK